MEFLGHEPVIRCQGGNLTNSCESAAMQGNHAKPLSLAFLYRIDNLQQSANLG